MVCDRTFAKKGTHMKKIKGVIIIIILLFSSTFVVNANQNSSEIIYHKNLPSEAAETRVMEVTEGDRVLGYHEYGGGFTSGSNWVQPWSAKGLNKLFNFFVAWNTKEDGSGKYFRGGRILTATDLQYIENEGGNLYQIWRNPTKMINYLTPPTPQIFINQSTAFDSAENALNLGVHEDFSLEANLTQAKEQSLVLWGRLDKWGDNATSAETTSSKGIYGVIFVDFDHRLVFKENLETTLELTSPWLEFDAPNATTDPNTGNSLLVISSNDIKVENGLSTLQIPVKMKNKNNLAQMELDEFNAPMHLSLFSDTNMINLFTKESWTEISNSDENLVSFSGRLELTVDVKDARTEKSKSKSNSQYIKMHSVDADPITIIYQDTKGNVIAPSVDLNGIVGESYSVEIIEISGYKFIESQGALSGIFLDSPQTVTLVYERLGKDDGDEDTEKPVDPKPTDPEESIDDGSEKEEGTEELPNTGESNRVMQTGIALLTLGVFLVVVKSVKKKSYSKNK